MTQSNDALARAPDPVVSDAALQAVAADPSRLGLTLEPATGHGTECYQAISGP